MAVKTSGWGVVDLATANLWASCEEEGEAEQAELAEELEGEVREEGDGEWIEDDAPTLPIETAREQARRLRGLCGELDYLRREWKLANSRRYQAWLEVQAAIVKRRLAAAIDGCFASELEHVAD